LSLTLSMYFGTLTARGIVLLLNYKITPVVLTTLHLRRLQIRSSIPGRPLSQPKPRIGALPRNPSPERSACEQSRAEPAISSLDWTFTPIPRSHQGFAHHYGFGPPRRFPNASPCPGIDRLVSGIQVLTDGERTMSLVNCGQSVSLRLRRCTP
jgi:hypothetical protein